MTLKRTRRRQMIYACLALYFAMAVSSARADEPAPQQPKRYTTKSDHDPNGIGKFYMGREIARVMGYQGAGWLERPQREKEEKLSVLVKALKLKPGEVVADIGAGSGVITRLLARAVTPKGKVYAVDIQEEMLSRLVKGMKAEGITNVEPVLGTEDDPGLKPDSVDLAIMVDVYHEFAYPWEMTSKLARALKPGGRLVFVEYRKEDPKVRRMIKLIHTMTEAQVKKEIGQPEFGLKWVETLDPLPVQHIIIFEKPKPAANKPVPPTNTSATNNS